MNLLKILLLSSCAVTLVNCASKSASQTATAKQSQTTAQKQSLTTAKQSQTEAPKPQAGAPKKLANWEIRSKIALSAEEKQKIKEIEDASRKEENDLKSNTSLSAEEQKKQAMALWIKKEKLLFEAMSPEHQAQFKEIQSGKSQAAVVAQAAAKPAAVVTTAVKKNMPNWEIRQKMKFSPEEKQKMDAIEAACKKEENDLKNNTSLSAEEQKKQAMALWMKREKLLLEAMSPEHQAEFKEIKKASQQ